MTKYLISFDDGAMNFPPEDLPEVDRAAHAVVESAKAAGVWVFGGGLTGETTVVATDGSVGGPRPEKEDYVGGFCVVDVRLRDEALQWAAEFAVACRCAQEVREIMYDPKA